MEGMKGGSYMKSLTRWDPFRMMKHWDPIDELRTMQHEMDRLFDRFLEASCRRADGPLDAFSRKLYKRRQAFFKAELPGVDPKDLDVSINANRDLVIKGERKAEKAPRKRTISIERFPMVI